MTTPPRLARWLLARCVHPHDREHFLGDVDDAFALRAEHSNERLARRWYWRQTLSSSLPLAVHRIRSLAESLSHPTSHGDPMWRDILDDLRHAVRLSKRNPVSAFAIVATMVLGIGAVTAVFSVVNGVLLQPLPFPESAQVVQLGMTLRSGREVSQLSYPDIQDFRRDVGSLAAISAVSVDALTLTQGDEPQQLHSASVDSGYAGVFSLRPLIGRLFEPDEYRFGSRKVVVLSNGTWQRQFGGDRSIVGRTISLEHEPYVVVGVLPPQRYVYPFPNIDVLVPLIISPGTYQLNRGALWVRAVARVKPGVSRDRGMAEILERGKRLIAEFPDAYGGLQYRVEPLRQVVVGDVRPMLLLLSASVAAVLLIACVNVANLLLGQSHARARELAVRSALGGSAGRLRRQLLAESMWWAAVGGVIGTALAPVLTRAFIVLYPGELPRVNEVSLDLRVLAIALAATIAAGLLSAVPMMRRAVATDLTRDLRTGGRGGTAGQRRLSGVLVTSQVAISLVLLFTAGLLVRSFDALMHVDPGFTSHGLTTFNLYASPARYPKGEDVLRYYASVDAALRTIPGTAAVGTSTEMPFNGNGSSDVFVDKQHGDLGHENPQVRIATVNPDYWSAIGARVVSGRGFTAADSWGAPHVVVINQALADKYYHGENPVGRTIDWNRLDWQIVGVVQSSRMRDLWSPAEPELYTSSLQNVKRSQYVIVRSSMPAEQLLPVIRRAVHLVDPTVALTDVATMDERVAVGLAPHRFRAALVVGLGLVALALSIVGMYGVVSYAVTRQTREIGIRMALGEEASRVLRRIVFSALRIALVGAAIGSVLALAAGRSLGAFLVGVSPRDPAMLAASVLVLTLVGAAAAFIPARRASRVDPLVALRSE